MKMRESNSCGKNSFCVMKLNGVDIYSISTCLHVDVVRMSEDAISSATA